MSIYSNIKDVAEVLQKADNIDLYRKLIDVSNEALEIQDEVIRLREENAQLKKRGSLENVVVRHEEPIVTRSDDTIIIYYCAHCWDNEEKLIQVNCCDDGRFDCPHCNNSGTYDRKKREEHDAALTHINLSF